MSALKLCPFCGLAGYVESQFGREWWVQCQSGHSTGIVHPTKAQAEEEWNRRFPIEAAPAKDGGTLFIRTDARNYMDIPEREEPHV